LDDSVKSPRAFTFNDAVRSGKVVFDEKTWMPLSLEVTQKEKGQFSFSTSNTKTVEAFKDGAFELEIPEGALVQDLTPLLEAALLQSSIDMGEEELNF
ncbi:MAG: hypothetical protein HOM34_07035, partial [Planctomycetes bacterium]|nr:hypothetical protein [Planctomycetota bacterium]